MLACFTKVIHTSTLINHFDDATCSPLHECIVKSFLLVNFTAVFTILIHVLNSSTYGSVHIVDE